MHRIACTLIHQLAHQTLSPLNRSLVNYLGEAVIVPTLKNLLAQSLRAFPPTNPYTTHISICYRIHTSMICTFRVHEVENQTLQRTKLYAPMRFQSQIQFVLQEEICAIRCLYVIKTILQFMLIRILKSFNYLMFTFNKYPFLAELGLQQDNYGASLQGTWKGDAEWAPTYNPNTGEAIAQVKLATLQQYEQGMAELMAVKDMWAQVPIPKRGEIVRQIGDEFRKYKEPLGMLVSLEMGKIKSEGLGEIQEIIDICDMACGLSRALYGLVIPSERPNHFMMEQWNPLGVVGIITAFNFPAAVLGWNLALALVCGDVCVWKGAPSTNLVSIAVTNIIHNVLRRNSLPTSLFFTICGDGVQIGEAITTDRRIPLISFTGSTHVGKIIAQKVASRLGRCLLELGGNNAEIVCQDANLELALKAAVFAAVGTCGQRCTSLRRLLLHESIADALIQKMVKAYGTIRVGDALEPETLCGPLHGKLQIEQYKKVIPEIVKSGGKLLFGGKVIERPGNFVEPTIFEVESNNPFLQQELFMPILFVVRFKTLEEAIAINNSVPQGLSSALFTQNLSNAYLWTGPLGSDCGITNVNIGTSGAEIGGAFGGEKETGGGRESGSDSWKQYMRRSTCTINFGKDLPLAQGVKFDI